MDLNFAGFQIGANIVEKSNIISAHTHHELERIKINIIIYNEAMNEDFIKHLEALDEGNISSKFGDETKLWKLINESHSYNNMESVNYTLELEEIEELKLDSLILDDLKLEPELYIEDFGFDDSLNAKVRVRLSEDQFKSFKKLMKDDSISVIRHGINEEPRLMRLNIKAWSKDEAGIKCAFVLFDERDKAEYGFFSPWMWNLIDLVIRQDLLIERLSSLLIQKEILKREEYESIRAEIPDQNLERELELYHVKDLDDWE